mmetsp:Transcript_16538/g.57945  ORF Transcript_16538/g.57945 Transcript_16538/m.57945 type:complete len:111 (-) Transcript_16538:74-406(-)
MVLSEAEKALKAKEEREAMARKKLEKDRILKDQAADRDYFTVWSTSLTFGCAKGELKDKAGDVWVCQYGPAGNYIGQFSAKVNATVKTVCECGGKTTKVPSDKAGCTDDS